MKKIVTEKVKSSLAEMLVASAEKAKSLGQLDYETLPSIILEVPKEKSFGNFSANLAMVLAKQAHKAPREIAQIIINNFESNSYVEKCEVAGAGFINFYLNRTWLIEVLQKILDETVVYGSNTVLDGQKIQLEFVSANPVGPMNVVNARAAALGDTLGRLFSACGAKVEREYYVNDHGVQIDTLGRSVDARYRELLGEQIEFPEECYQGEYIIDIAKEILERDGDSNLQLSEEDRIVKFKDFSYKKILESQKRDLADYGVEYDCWFSERTLHESGKVNEALRTLEEKGLTFAQDDAVWLRTTDFGDDKDRVLCTNDGRTTYFTADIAYHLNKFARGYDLAIDIWGPDHHGYIPRVKAAMLAMGIAPERFEVLIAQQINLIKDGKPYKMSKRRGNFITMTELLEEVGHDAARWFFLMRSPDSHLDFDLTLAASHTSDNPVFYVQYAHARICSIFNQDGAVAVGADDIAETVQCWGADEDLLLEKLAHFPGTIIEAARQREPHRLTAYLLDLAGTFHSYYNRNRFINDDRDLTKARLLVATAVKTVLRQGLYLLGVSAPEKM